MAKNDATADEVSLKVSDVEQLLVSIARYNLDLASNTRAQRWEETIVPYLQSKPGTGKTSICWSAADLAGLQFRGFIGAQYDPTELAGFNFFNKNSRTSWRAKPDMLPTEGRWLLLCDEFGQMTMMQKNVMAQLIQERRLGEHRLSPEATLVLAGNRQSDRAGVQPDPTHVIDRVFKINVVADREDWCKWALSHGVRPEIVSYVRYRPNFFDDFDPARSKNASPRGWTKVSTIIDLSLPGIQELAAVQGQVGPGPAADFVGYLRVYRDLPDIDQLIANPKTGYVPPKDKPDVCYSICGALAHRATKKNIGAILTYAERLPGEFSVMLVKDTIQRDKEIQSTSEIRKWLHGPGADLVIL